MSIRTRFRTSLIAFGALSGVALSAGSADACGGLFCSAANPVNQAAERIIFAKNDDGTVTAAIEIMYEGPAHEFAWVLPVPAGKVDVAVSSKILLDRLDNQSNPQYNLTTQFADGCAVPESGSVGGFPTSPPSAMGPKDGGVQVVAEGNAGPYTYAQLMVDPLLPNPEDAAIAWLELNQFDVGKLAPELLREYLKSGQNLLAFKLQKGKNSGSVRPVLLTYKSDQPLIPIKPTAVAANEDMGVKVWVLGDSRAIPSNYPHLELNEAMINWFNASLNYNDVIIAAANEAGGHGFVTEQSGPAGAFADILYADFEKQSWDQLRTGKFGSMLEFLQTAQQMFGSYDGFQDVMTNPKFVPLREGATHEQFLSCMNCYFETNVPVRNAAYPSTDYLGQLDPIHSLEVLPFLDEFYRLVIQPLEDTSQLFKDHSTVTRMYTTLSPDEMSEDPIFDFNAELGSVNNIHTANRILQCDGSNNEWRVELAGMSIKGTGQDWPITLDSDFPVNLRIVQFGASGGGKLIKDNAPQIANLLTDLKLGEAKPELMAPTPSVPVTPGEKPPAPTTPDLPDDEKDPVGEGPSIDGMQPAANSGGGGCSVATPASTSGGAAHLAWLGLLGLGWMRRRQG